MGTRFTILLAGALLCAGSAAADDKFGAIAYSPQSQAYGLSIDRGSRGEAEKAALSLCAGRGAPDCQPVLWFRNGCGAMAIGALGYGGGTGTTTALADRYAMKSCALYGGAGCAVTRHVCTSNAKSP